MFGYKLLLVLVVAEINSLAYIPSESSNCAFDIKGTTSTNIFMNTFRLKNGVKSGYVDLRKNAYSKEKCNNKPIGVITLACDDPRNHQAPAIVTTFNKERDSVKIRRVSETFTGETEIQIFVYCEEMVHVDIDNFDNH